MVLCFLSESHENDLNNKGVGTRRFFYFLAALLAIQLFVDHKHSDIVGTSRESPYSSRHRCSVTCLERII